MGNESGATIAMVACIILFGIQFVPAKRNETYNGTVFHWFMCSGSLFTGLVLGVAMAGEFPVGTLEGVSGGALVAISNTLVLHVKQSLGMFSGVVIYQTANLVTGYAVGRFGLFGARADPGRIPWLRDLGIGTFLFSLGLAFVANPDASGRVLSLSAPLALSREEELAVHFGSVHPEHVALDHVHLADSRHTDTSESASIEDGAVGPVPQERGAAALQHHQKRRPCSEHIVGGMLAVLAGFFRGLNPLPFYEWRLLNPDEPKGVFVFPQALGVWMAGTLIYLGYASGKKVLHLPSPHHPHIRPAFLSGCLWSAGFVCFAHALDGFGFTAAYTLSVIGSVFVSQILSVLVFKEIRDWEHLVLFGSSCIAQAASMMLIAAGT